MFFKKKMHVEYSQNHCARVRGLDTKFIYLINKRSIDEWRITDDSRGLPNKKCTPSELLPPIDRHMDGFTPLYISSHF